MASMPTRAVWKGHLVIDTELACPVALHTAVSASARLSFHILNRRTEHRVVRSYVDTGTGATVESSELKRGYDTGSGFVVLSSEDIAAAAPESDKKIEVQGVVPCGEIDRLYFDRPYYLTPSPGAERVYAQFRQELHRRSAAAIGKAVLFRRFRTLLIRPHGRGLIATIMNFDYEVRSPDEAFAEIPEIEIDPEMLDLAQEIVRRKAGHFDPAGFSDRYEAALAELVRAKAEGRKITPRKRKKVESTTDLLQALRKSAAA